MLVAAALVDRAVIDLGAGGAFVQGRWAWAKERKSLIEASVAERTPFRSSSNERRSINLIIRVIILIVLSWFAVIFTGLAILSFPLAVGRSFYHLLRIPPKYIHDPFAFCIGAGLFFPMISFLSRSINAVNGSLWSRWRQCSICKCKRKLLCLFINARWRQCR